jgi:hypothetical protein
VARFGRHLAMVRVAYGEAPAPRFAPVVAMQVRAPASSVDSA